MGRLGARTIVTSEARLILDADRLVLPGVGTLGAAMEELRQRDIVEALQQRLTDGRPALAICLGLQMLLSGSEESPGVAALGIAKGMATRFSDDVRVPHLGWSRIGPPPLTDGAEAFAYFAHSYRVTEPPPGWSASWCEHGGRFVAAMWKGATLACQFHPELSGAWGARMLSRWFAGEGMLDLDAAVKGAA